jgi:hypothetical protein
MELGSRCCQSSPEIVCFFYSLFGFSRVVPVSIRALLVSVEGDREVC